MYSRIRDLREKRAAIHEQAKELLKKGKLTSEDREHFQRMMDQMDVLKVEIELAETKRPPEAQVSGFDEGVDSSQERRAFDTFLRSGAAALSSQQRTVLREVRDMGVGGGSPVGSLGGFFVPQGFVYDVETALKYYGNMLGVAKILDTATGQPLPYPTSNDTTVTGELVGEASSVTSADVNVGHIMFGAFKFSTKMVKCSLELLQDSAFNIEAFLKERFAIRLGRVLNQKFTTGQGTTEPTGIITSILASLPSPQLASAGVVVGTPLIAAGSAANTGGSETGATSIGSQDLVNLEHTVDSLYRPRASYMMHDSTLRVIKTLLDRYGRPLWQPGIASGEPDRINGYAYSINNDMDAIAASKVTVLFGPMEKYLIRRVKELAVLRLEERFAEYGQVAFLGFARYDGNLLDAGTHPMSYLIQHS